VADEGEVVELDARYLRQKSFGRTRLEVCEKASKFAGIEVG